MKTGGWGPSAILLAVAVGGSFFSLRAATRQSSESSKLNSDVQLRSVLILARDAVIAEASLRTGNSSVSEDVKQLTRFMLLSGDRDDVFYLQQHLIEEEAAAIHAALDPAGSLTDFSIRVRIAEQEEDDYRHDNDLLLIISEETDSGFLEDALANGSRIRYSDRRCHALGEVALSAFSKGDLRTAQNAVAKAEDIALQPPAFPYHTTPNQEMLRNLATQLQEGGYRQEAHSALARARQLMESASGTPDIWWVELAETALALDDFKMASYVLNHVKSEEYRADIQEKIKFAQIQRMNPGQALEAIKTMDGPGPRVSLLCGIAERQGLLGDTRGAGLTIQGALEEAVKDKDYLVYRLDDIAWTQITVGDRNGARATVDQALQENEEWKPGSEQVNGWVMLADTLAFLGDFEHAHKIVPKIKDDYFTGRALRFIAYREVIAGHTQEALRWSREVQGPVERSAAFLGVAAALIEQLTGKPADLSEF